MDQQEQPTSPAADASPIDRLERFLSADEAPEPQASPAPTEQRESEQADAPTETDSEPADEQKPDSETPNEYHLSDIAKLLGADESTLDVDDDGNVMVRTKIDGQEGKAKFADLVKSYQLQGHVDKQVREAAEMRKAAQEQAAAVQQQAQIQQHLVGQIADVKAVEAELGKYHAINWRDLYDNDPATAAKLDHQYRELQQQHAQKVEAVNQAHQQIQQQSEQQRQVTLVEERKALLKAVPEWTDDARAAKDKEAIVADLKSRGYSERDLQNLSDHKAVLLARDAWLYRQQQTANKAAEKQVRAAPKIIKPGASGQGNSQAKTLQNIKSDVRRTGSKQSVVDYLLASGKV